MKMKFTFLFLTTFLCSYLYSATFSSKASGNWSLATTWNITGADADGVPDADDDVTINAAHTITLTATSSTFKTLVINASGILNANNKNLIAKGNFTINGSVIGTMTFYVQTACIFSSSSPFTNPGNWNVQADLTISASTVINKINYFNISTARTVTNLGRVNLGGGAISFAASSSRWINGSGASLTVARNITGNGLLDASAATNTVTYNNSLITQIHSNGTYYDLNIGASSTKSVTSTLTVLNTFSLSSATNNILNLNNQSMNVGGNWVNAANTDIQNQGTITFNTSTTQTITRNGGSEVFSNMRVNGSGTTSLGSNIDATILTITSGTLDVSASNRTINVKQSLVNNGSLDCRTGQIVFNGNVASTISGSSNTQFYDLVLNNAAGLTINSSQSVTNSLAVTSGNFNSNGNITLVSNASTTARIAPVSGTLSGNMTIQQFISARTKGWHDLSSPVQNTTINDWDNEMYMSGIGPYDGVAGPAGVDGSASGFASVYIWDESLAKYTQVSGSGTSLAVGKGYEIWLADDQTNWYAKTIDTRGVPNFGSKTINLSFAGPAVSGYKGLNLVGNPFASQISLGACTKTQVSSSVLILDNSGNYNDYGANATIPPHQGFWLTATGLGSNIVIPEASKVSNTTTNYYRTKPEYAIKFIFSSSTSPYFNENTINFQPQTTEGYDAEYDAPYIKSPLNAAPAIFMMDKENNGALIKNAINSDKDFISIPLGFYTPEAGMYTISSSIINREGYDKIWFENKKTGQVFDLANGDINIEGLEDNTNTDWVLYLSKSSRLSSISQATESDLILFNTENTFNVKSANTNRTISSIDIFDISGKQIFTQKEPLTINAGEIKSFDISYLPQGIYVINITDTQGTVHVKKIIK